MTSLSSVMTLESHRPSCLNISQLSVPTHLQDPAADVSVTGLALNAKLGVVVRLAVRNAIPARGNPHRKRKLEVLWKFQDLQLMGSGPQLGALGGVCSLNTQTPQTPLGSMDSENPWGPGNLYLDKLPKHAWGSLVCCWPGVPSFTPLLSPSHTFSRPIF